MSVSQSLTLNKFMGWLRTTTMTTVSPPQDASLKIEGISKTFVSQQGKVVHALAPTTLAVSTGEFVCFLGPSGCGKSTLLSLIAGLEQPSSGQIKFGQQPIQGTNTDRVLLFQDGALFPWLDVQGNIEFGLRQIGKSKEERAEIAHKWLERMNLIGFEHHNIYQLSGGMRQRVAIARAFAINPAMLLMDEPFAALDAMTRDRLHHELEHLWASTRKTVIFVTHNVREAVALGDRVMVFSPRPGRIVAEFKVDLPRPRSLENVALVEKTAEIMAVLQQIMAEGDEPL